jgi:hypothetical protein
MPKFASIITSIPLLFKTVSQAINNTT